MKRKLNFLERGKIMTMLIYVTIGIVGLCIGAGTAGWFYTWIIYKFRKRQEKNKKDLLEFMIDKYNLTDKDRYALWPLIRDL
jgi:hypothetical protein